MRSARLEPDPQQRVLGRAARSTSKWVTASRGVSVSRDCLVGSRRSRPMGASIRPRPRARPAADEREVLALERAPADEALQLAVCLLAARDHEQTRRIAVEAVDDARPLAIGRLSAPSAQSAAASVPLRLPAPGMDDDARRLVDDEQVLVLPGERAPQALAPPRGSDGHRWARNESPRRRRGGGSSAGRSRRPVHRRRRSSRSASRARADGGLLREEPVEPQPCGGLRYARARSGAERRRAVPPARASLPREHRPDEQDDADDDADVREVERRPVAEVEEVRHMARAGRGRRGSRCSRRAGARAPLAARDGAHRRARRRRASTPRRPS